MLVSLRSAFRLKLDHTAAGSAVNLAPNSNGQARYMHRCNHQMRTAKSVKATLCLLIAFVLACAADPLAAQDAIGSLKRVKGDVVVQRADQRIKAENGTTLYHGDRLITGKNAYAYVEIAGTAPLAVGSETEVSLDRFASGGKPVARLSAPRLVQGLASFLALNRQR
jgi:hypothetical protein